MYLRSQKYKILTMKKEIKTWAFAEGKMSSSDSRNLEDVLIGGSDTTLRNLKFSEYYDFRFQLPMELIE